MTTQDMIRTFSLIIVFILTSLISFAQDSYAIKNVSVITMTKEEVLPDQTVVVEKGIIKKHFTFCKNQTQQRRKGY